MYRIQVLIVGFSVAFSLHPVSNFRFYVFCKLVSCSHVSYDKKINSCVAAVHLRSQSAERNFSEASDLYPAARKTP